MKTALVTGGAKGLGAEIATLASEKGYKVVIFDVIDGGAFAKTLKNATSYVVDVTDEKAVEAALEKIGAVPDVLVNNAGIVSFGLLLDQTIESFRKVVDINMVACFIVARAVARGMVKRGSGAIINITSLNAITPSPGSGAYPAAKAGLAKMTEHMAIEWGPSGVRVNAIAPGLIDGGMSAPIYANPKARAVRTGGVPLRRLGTPRDVAEAVMFLASDEGAYISAQHIGVDGGIAPSVMALLPRD